jgi:hypothetical protein
MRLPSNPTAASLLRTALGYAYRGWEVLPVVPKGKRPLTKNGVLEASADIDQVVAWWTHWPMANIGLRTGGSFDVLDIDGDDGMASLVAELGPGASHPGPISRTGKGEHWLFAPTGTANRTGLLPSIDWRGTNGYIIAAPSIHPTGSLYVWDETNGPDTPLPQPPDWLLPYLTEWTETAQDDGPPIRVWLPNPHQPKSTKKAVAYNLPPHVEGQLTDIVALAEEMGLHPRRDGRLFAIHCIFHKGDREPSMKLYPADNSFYCYGCGAWGDSMNLKYRRKGGTRAQG